MLHLIWPSLRRVRGRLALMLILILITAGTQVLEPVVYGRIIDLIVSQLTTPTEVPLLTQVVGHLAVWIGLFIATTLLSTWLLYTGWKAGNDAGNHFAQVVARDILHWSHQQTSSASGGRIIKLFDQAWEGVFGIVDTIFLQALPTMTTFLFVIGVGFWIDWRLTLASLALLPISLGIGYYAFKHANPKQEQLSSEWADSTQHMAESISNHTEVRNFAQEERRERGFIKLIDAVLKRQLEINVFWSVFYGVGGGLQLLARVLVFVVGILLVSGGATTLGTLITFLGLLSFILTPVQYLLSNGLPRISKAFASFKLLVELLGHQNDVQESPTARTLKQVHGTMDLQNIALIYKDQTTRTLSNVTLRIPAGTSCALVGPSGAGKSTLAKLFNRTLDPTQGSITLDGAPLSDYTLTSLRSHIGVVAQDTPLFHDTILANIRFVRPSASKQEVIEACKKAQAHTLINKLPKGYKSIVGERGVKLSGGERQRIAIARIFLANTPILILDESTSALDSETESKLQKTLARVMKGRTTILIAHRLSTIYLADQIVVMEHGKIVDQGSHDELVENGGLYHRLWNLQSGGYLT